MPDVGSDGWIKAFADRAARVAVDPDASLVIQQELTDTGARWCVVIDEGHVSVARGTHPDADVTLSQDAATAAAIEAGELSAQQAFLDGRLRVRGAVGRLVDAAAALAAVGA